MATSSSSTCASARTAVGVLLPVYDIAPGAVLRAVENASSVELGATDDAGEYLAMAMVESTLAAAVLEGAIIVLPMTELVEGGRMDFTYLAASHLMFIRVNFRPQPRLTYGQCIAYTDGFEELPVPVGTTFKFPSVTNYLVAKPELVTVLRNTSVPNLRGVNSDNVPAKRVCLRPLDSGGELAEEGEDKLKGTSTYLLDLEGVKRATRNKTDIPQRERDTHFVFRAMDTGKLDYSISTDLVLQPEAYRSMVCEQGDTQTDDQHPAFTACGLISRVQSLKLFQNKEKLKLLLVGAVLIEGNDEPTLTLEDFVTKEPISNQEAPCANHNSGMVAVLKNLAMVLHILFSDAFENSLATFICHLEGAKRIMEVVPADFLRHSVELALRKFFRTVRSVKASAIVEMRVASPEQCSTYLTWLFDRLAEDLSNHPSMVKQMAYYRCRLSRSPVTKVKANEKTEKAVKFADKPAEPKAQPSKPCAGHLGSLLGAVNKDGRAYACTHGSNCKFRHVTVTGRTDQKLNDLVASMPATAQVDLKRAIKSRK